MALAPELKDTRLEKWHFWRRLNLWTCRPQQVWLELEREYQGDDAVMQSWERAGGKRRFPMVDPTSFNVDETSMSPAKGQVWGVIGWR